MSDQASACPSCGHPTGKVNSILKDQLDQIRTFDKAHTVGALLGDALKAGTVIAIAVVMLRIVQAIAGTQTSFEFLLDVRLTEGVAWALAGTGAYAAARERKLRKRHHQQHDEYVRELEKKLDPQRSSSRWPDANGAEEHDPWQLPHDRWQLPEGSKPDGDQLPPPSSDQRNRNKEGQDD